MSYAERSAAMRAELRVLNRTLPQTMRGFADLSKAAKEEGPLSVKEREYVALGISVALRCEPCITFHLEALRKAGASRDEVAAVLAMAVQMGGGPAVMYAAHALAAWDELSGAAAAPAGG